MQSCDFYKTSDYVYSSIAPIYLILVMTDWRATGILIHCWWESKMVQPLWKTVLQFLAQLNILFPSYAAITLFGIYPKELKPYIHTKTCTGMLMQALFRIAKTWKQLRCPFSRLMDKWHCGTFWQWNIIQCQKEMSYQATERNGATLNAHY